MMEIGNRYKNKWIITVIIASTLILSACANKPVAPPALIETKAERLEKRAQEDTLKRDYLGAGQAARDALRLYAILDDQPGQLRSHLNLTRLYILQNQRNKATRHLAKAKMLDQDLDAPLQTYQVHLLAGKINNDPAEFKLARDLANSPLEQAVAETYLDNYKQAKSLINTVMPVSAPQEDDYAFVLLNYARFTDDAQSVSDALALYKKNENTTGISDSLYILAMIAKKQGNKAQADSYLRRALEVNLAMGDEQRIAATVEALEK